MGCEEFRELVSAFVDEQLDGDELLLLHEHLRACAGCRAFEVEVRRLRGLLRAAEAFRPPRRPPPGFAARVVARIDQQPAGATVPFPEVRGGRRLARAPWIGLAAAAAVAALFFTWSWQRLLTPEIARNAPLTKQEMVADVSMDTWMREHAMSARESSLLGSAEEIEFARIHPGAVPER